MHPGLLRWSFLTGSTHSLIYSLLNPDFLIGSPRVVFCLLTILAALLWTQGPAYMKVPKIGPVIAGLNTTPSDYNGAPIVLGLVTLCCVIKTVTDIGLGWDFCLMTDLCWVVWVEGEGRHPREGLWIWRFVHI